jgi:hypothetical protein
MAKILKLLLQWKFFFFYIITHDWTAKDHWKAMQQNWEKELAYWSQFCVQNTWDGNVWQING